MEDTKTTTPIPITVGEMIDFLKKFPRSHVLDVYVVDHGDYATEYESQVYHMDFHELRDYGSLEITVR